MKKEIKLISKDISRLFLILGGFVLILLIIFPLVYGAKWALPKIIFPVGIGVILIIIAGIYGSIRAYWKSVKKRARNE